MKFTINIDCTPDEARAFLGLPDVKPLHAAMLKQMQEQMQSMDVNKMMELWMPAANSFQNFMQNMMSAGTSSKDET